jgi:hypothetical protein
MIDYTAILSRKYNAEWTLNGDEYAGLVWLSDSKKPTKTELDALWDLVQQEIADEVATKEAARSAVLAKLDLTEDEIKSLLA